MFSSTDPIETGANSSPALADYMLLSSELSRCPSTIVAFLYFFILTADCRWTSHTCNSISCSSISRHSGRASHRILYSTYFLFSLIQHLSEIKSWIRRQSRSPQTRCQVVRVISTPAYYNLSLLRHPRQPRRWRLISQTRQRRQRCRPHTLTRTKTICIRRGG